MEPELDGKKAGCGQNDADHTNGFGLELDALYSTSVVVKIWGVASRAFNRDAPPSDFPEYTEPGGTKYMNSDVSFWTSGFFPGCLYLLRQRQIKHPSRFPTSSNTVHPSALEFGCKWWSATPKLQAARTDTHDLGFMIQPWAQLGWALDSDRTCFDAMVTAARNLAARFDPRVGAIRSWDSCKTKVYEFVDPESDFLVIIDNMVNLELLYQVSALIGDLSLAHIASTHALTTLRSHVRFDYSTVHLAVFGLSKHGVIKAKLTHQGYNDESCWTRGQAWAMLGFIQCYKWVKDSRFLDAALHLSRYWIKRLPENGVVPWDFDAEQQNGSGEPRDSSATLVGAYALLLIHEALNGDGYAAVTGEADEFLHVALKSVRGIISTCLSPVASFKQRQGSERAEIDLGQGPESIIMHATINNYEHAQRRWADTGLVYADYYFLLIGNKLLDMGIVQ